MVIPRNIFGQLAECIIEGGARKATKYLNEREVVKATARLYGGKFDRRSKSLSILFTVGAPNHAERKFIREAKAAGLQFPIRRIQLKWPAGKLLG